MFMHAFLNNRLAGFMRIAYFAAIRQEFFRELVEPAGAIEARRKEIKKAKGSKAGVIPQHSVDPASRTQKIASLIHDSKKILATLKHESINRTIKLPIPQILY